MLERRVDERYESLKGFDGDDGFAIDSFSATDA